VLTKGTSRINLKGAHSLRMGASGIELAQHRKIEAIYAASRFVVIVIAM
jgi:hypothetical protein